MVSVIDRIIEWHQTIKEHVKLIGDSISDREALMTLEKIRPEWIPGQPGVESEKQKRLMQVISFLDEGLRNHFAYEEEYLPPLLGEIFMRALILDHQEVKKEINEAKSMVAGVNLEGLSRDELLLRESAIQEKIARVCQIIEEHAGNEEIIMGMARRALQ